MTTLCKTAHLPPHAPRLAASALLALALGACGGSIQTVKVDTTKLPPEKQQEISAKDSAVSAAQTEADKAQQEATAARDKVAAAEADLAAKKGDLDITKKTLSLEKAKSKAGRTEAVGTAEADVDAKDKALDVAKKTLDHAEAEKDYLDAVAEEKKAALKVARADLELTKLNAVGGSGPEYDEKHADFEKQYREAQADHADAKKKVAQKKSHLMDAENDLKGAQAG